MKGHKAVEPQPQDICPVSGLHADCDDGSRLYRFRGANVVAQGSGLAVDASRDAQELNGAASPSHELPTEINGAVPEVVEGSAGNGASFEQVCNAL